MSAINFINYLAGGIASVRSAVFGVSLFRRELLAGHSVHWKIIADVLFELYNFSNKEKLSGTEAFKKLKAGSHPEILEELLLSINKKKMVVTESFKMLVKTYPEMLMELYLAN